MSTSRALRILKNLAKTVAFGLILGVKSIGNFKKGKSLGRNPIGTLIVGIGGLAFGAMGVLMSLVVFFSAATRL